MTGNKLLGGTLLITGTTIGAGMLALPVSIGMGGFWPGLVVFVLAWLYMTYTAFLFLEIDLHEEEESNILSMTAHTLGRAGRIISWIAYMFLLYAILTAYVSGCGSIFTDFVEYLTGMVLPDWQTSLPLLVFLSYFIYRGASAVDSINRVMMVGLVIAYIVVIFIVSPSMQGDLLARESWIRTLPGIPVVVAAFAYHMVIPSVATYLNRDVPKLRKAIIIGGGIPLLVYIVWQVLTLGVVPFEGEYGLLAGYEKGYDGAKLIASALGKPWVTTVARLFSFFAIITSFLGVGLSLFDFLADGLKIRKTHHRGRLTLCMLTFLPPLGVALIDSRAFLSALEYVGILAIALMGLLPALMVWSARYRKNFTSDYKAPGGKPALVMVMTIAVVMIVMQVMIKMGFFQNLI